MRFASARSTALVAPRTPFLAMLVGVALHVTPNPTLAAQRATARAAVAGTINDNAGAPVVDASVRLVGTKSVARSDSSGRFRLDDLPPGAAAFEVRHLGFPTTRHPATLVAGEQTTLAIVLPDSDVNALDLLGPDAEGFLQRRARRTSGYFLDYRQIDASKAIDIAQVLRTVPAVEILVDKFGQQTVRMRSAKSNGDRCRVRLFIDWAPYTGQLSDFLTSSIGAMEVYPLGSGMPPQFDPGRAQCGVIVLWSRLPNPTTADDSTHKSSKGSSQFSVRSSQ